MYKVALFLIISCFSFFLSAQPEQKLVYLIEGADLYEEDIDAILRRLKFAKSEKRLFVELASINSYYRTKSSEIALNSAIAKLSKPNENDLSLLFEDSNEDGDELSKIILNCNRYLHVRIKSYPRGFELKFRSFYLNNGKTTDSPLESRIFLDPTEAQNFQMLKTAMKKVFLESHEPPEIEFFTSNMPKMDSFFFASTSDTVNFRPEVISYDGFTASEHKWKVLEGFPMKGFNSSKKSQRLYELAPGDYKIGLTVFDGVYESTEKSVLLRVIPKPVIRRIPDRRKRINRVIIRNTLFGSNYALFSSEMLFSIESNKVINNDSLLIRYQFKNPAGKKLINSTFHTRFDTLGFVPSFSVLNFPSLRQAAVSGNTTVGVSTGKRVINYYPDHQELNNRTITILNADKDLIKQGLYQLEFSAAQTLVESDTAFAKVEYIEQRPISLYVNYLMFPISNYRLMNAFLNYTLGMNIEWSQNLSITTAMGVSVASKIPEKFYGEIGVNIFDYTKRKEGSYTLLIYENPASDKIEAALGVKFSFVIPQPQVNFKLGAGIYYAFDKYFENPSNWIFGLNYSGNIYWPKRTKTN